MSNLSVIPEVKVETVPKNGAVVISSAVSTAIACLTCGQTKAVYSYIGAKKDLIFTIGACTCRQNAPNPGGEPAMLLTDLEYEQRRLLSELWKAHTLEEMKLAIPLTPARNKYTPAFRAVLDRLYSAKTIIEARGIIELYASADERQGAQ